MIELENLAMALADEDGDGWLSLSDNERNGWRISAGEVAAHQPEWLRVPDRERIVDEIHNHVGVCQICMGDGLLGYADVEGGKRVSCETCGGHEDAPGSGLVGAYDAADAIRVLLTEAP